MLGFCGQPAVVQSASRTTISRLTGMESEMAAELGEIPIEVVSDVVCPWCYVGKRRLEAALAKSGDSPVAVRWRPFQLDPTIPPQGLERRAYMRAKFRDDARLAEVHARLRAVGTEVGIDFDFDAISRSPNTLDAHRLIRWPPRAGFRTRSSSDCSQRISSAAGTIGDRSVLIEIARDSGLDAEAVDRRFGGDDDVEAGAGGNRRGSGDRRNRSAVLHLRLALCGFRSAERGGARAGDRERSLQG